MNRIFDQKQLRDSFDSIVTPDHVIHSLSRLKNILTRWPAILPTKTQPWAIPMKIGIHRDLLAISTAKPNGSGSMWIVREIDRELKYYTRCDAYRNALLQVPMRRDIDGQPVSPVLASEVAFIADRRVDESQHRVEELHVKTVASMVSVTLFVDANHFIDLKVPAGQSRSIIETKVDDKIIQADVSAKSLRRVVKAVRENGTLNTIVSVCGAMSQNNALVNAGIIASPKVIKT